AWLIVLNELDLGLGALTGFLDLLQDLLALLTWDHASIDQHPTRLGQHVRAVVIALDMRHGDSGFAERLVSTQLVVERLNALDDLRHAVDGIETTRRVGGMHGLSTQCHLNFGTTALASANAHPGWHARDHEVRVELF